jgi:4-amino-4-deoxy-L-arabinose transferase-like glycosyltransferase
MADIPRFRPADLVMLLLVLALAAGTRFGYLASCCDGAGNGGPLHVVHEPAPADQAALIAHVRDNGWFGSKAPFATKEEVTAHVSPGYPWLVGLLGRVVSTDKLDSTVRWIQAVLGTLTAGLYFSFARRVFRSRTVALIAGLFAALYPFWIIETATIDDGTLATFALAGCLCLGSKAGEKGGYLLSLLFGLVLAGLALVRAVFLPFSFVAVLWFLLRSRSLPRGWLCALLAFLGFANGLAPWTVRNLQVFHEPVPIVTSTWLHLWIGNNPEATGGPATEKMWRTAPKEELQKTASQPARYALLFKEATRESGVRFLRNRMRAALMFFFGERWLADGALAEVTPNGAEGMPDWLANSYELVLQATIFALFGLALLGWRWSYGWRWESVLATLAMLWAPLPYILGHAEALSGPRLPLDGVLLTYAAFALACLIPGVITTADTTGCEDSTRGYT